MVGWPEWDCSHMACQQEEVCFGMVDLMEVVCSGTVDLMEVVRFGMDFPLVHLADRGCWRRVCRRELGACHCRTSCQGSHCTDFVEVVERMDSAGHSRLGHSRHGYCTASHSVSW